MNVNIDINKLVFEGMAMSPSQRRMLQGVVEAELERLLATEGIPDKWKAGGVAPQVPSGAIQQKPGTNFTQMGQQIAQRIYGGMKL